MQEKQLEKYLKKAKKNDLPININELSKIFDLSKEKVRYWIDVVYGTL